MRGRGLYDRVWLAGLTQQGEAQRQQCRPAPVGEESEVPDAYKASRQRVQKKPPQKLV